MRDAVKNYLALAGGVTELTRQRAVAAAKALVAQGEATAEQVSSLAEDLLAQTKQNREAVVALVGFEVERALSRVKDAPADAVAQLSARVRTLETQLRAVSGLPGGTKKPSAPRPAPARKARAKPSTTTAAKPSGTTSPAKRAGAKALAKPSGTTSPARKAGAKAPVRKASPTKAPARKPSAAKVPAKKAPATAPAKTGPAATPAATPAAGT